MINLVPAKCPNCGAQLELDDNMKRAECKFCKSTIIVDEATKDYSDKIETARKYMKLKKYGDAERVIDNVLKEDELNLEAKKVLVELYDIEVSTLHTETEEDLTFDILETDCNNILKELNEIQVLDEEKVYTKFLEEYISKYENLSTRVKNAIDLKDNLLKKCNQYCNYNVAKLIKLLKALGYSPSSYNFGISKSIRTHDIEFGYDHYYPFRPKISYILSNNINIVHDSSKNKDEPDYRGLTKHDDHYKFTKEQKLSFSEQIGIVDKLLEEDNKSIFNKLFGK